MQKMQRLEPEIRMARVEENARKAGVTDERSITFKGNPAKCLQCSSGSMCEVRICPVEGCALYDFRFGHKPKRDGKNEGFEDESELGKENITETI